MDFERELSEFLDNYCKDCKTYVLIENTLYIVGNGKIYFKVDYPSGRLLI